MVPRAPIFVLCLVVSGPWGGCSPGGPTAALEQAIINGTLHAEHPAVGKLVFDYEASRASCTATLVGQKTVLTAAHCLGFTNTDFVTDAELGYRSVASIPHPDYDAGTPYLHDVGLVVLKLAPPIAPIRISIAPPAAGTPLTLVGYGESAEGLGDKVKRVATNTIEAVESLYFSIEGASGSEGNACHGDSGAPVLVQQQGEEVTNGVVSYSAGACGTTTYATRLDTLVPWLFAEAAGDIAFQDPEQPQASITSPADGATVGSTVQLTATATDNIGVVAVEARVDGAKQQEATAPPYSFALTLQPGQRVLEVVARDGAGNTGSAQVTVTVTGPPANSDGGTGAEIGTGADGAIDQPRGDDGCSFTPPSSDTHPPQAAGALGVLLVLAGVARRRHGHPCPPSMRATGAP